MLLKNLIVYRLPKNWALGADELENKLSRQPLRPCGSFAMESRGWLPPQDEARFLYTQSHHWLLTLGIELKLLPASVIRQVARERGAEIARKQAHPVGRKQMREIRDEVTNELLPRALARRTTTRAWIDSTGGWLAVDAAADKKAEEFLEALRRAEENFPCKRLDTQRSPGAAMTHWLATGKAPPAFSIDQDLELQSSDMSKSSVRYARHPLEGRDIREHISAGKTAIRLGLTWRDKISFVLTDQLHIKRITFLDILKSEFAADAEDESDNEAEQFDADFALMTGELSRMLADLVKALGGEKAPAS